jgi:RimJ/RimL family protein N-acetyltransferase
VADAVPPPRPLLTPPWSAAAVEPASSEVAVVQRWMASPHVARHWHQDWSLDEWELEVVAQWAGAHSRPWIIERDREPVAYVEIYRAAIDLLAESWTGDAHDLGVHLAVGDERRLRRGLGSGVLEAVTAGLFAAEPACGRVIGDPDASHAAARRTFASAGFVLAGEVDLPHKRAALMVCERPS